jgi:hypothetical protein
MHLRLPEGQGDRSRAFRACRLALDCLYAQGAAAVTFRPEYRRWAELAQKYADVDSRERLYADLTLMHAGFWSTDPQRRQEARAFRPRALALARHHAEALFRSAFHLLLTPFPQDWSERTRLAEECTGWPRQGVTVQTLGLVLYFAGCFQRAQAKRACAEKLWREVEQLAERTQVVSVRLILPQRDAMLAIIDGRLEDALVQWRRYVEQTDELGASLRGRLIGLLVLAAPAHHLGRADTWLAASDEFVGLGGSGDIPRAVCLAQFGRLEEARALVGPLLDEIAGRNDAGRPIAQLVNLLQAAGRSRPPPRGR